MKSLKLVLLLLAIASVGSSLVGCMSTSLVAHQPGLDSVNALRDSGIANVALGEFKVAPGVKTTTSVSARGSAFNAGAAKSATFADYLRSSMETDLRAAGKLDTASPLVIGSVITQNSLNAGGASSANSTLAARFTVTKGSQTLLDKELKIEHKWESSFVGAIALPTALNEYTEQYSRLLMQLYLDESFRKACSR